MKTYLYLYLFLTSSLLLCSISKADDKSDEKNFLDFLNVKDTVTDGYEKISTNGKDFLKNKIEGLQLGLIVLTQKSKYTDQHNQDVAVIINYEGFYDREWDLERFLGDNVAIEFIPTNATINFNGKKLRVLTNLATLDYFSDDGDFVVTISALSLAYKKNNNISILESSRLSVVEIEGAKVFTLDEDNLSDLEFELVGALGVGGINYTKMAINNDESKSFNDRTYGKVSFEAGVSLPLTADLPGPSFFGSGTDLRLSTGAYYQVGKQSDYVGTYIGLELNIGDTESGLNWNPYLKWNVDQVDYDGPYRHKVKDNVTELGVRVSW